MAPYIHTYVIQSHHACMCIDFDMGELPRIHQSVYESKTNKYFKLKIK